MCTTSGRDCGTSFSIFTKIDSVLAKHAISWRHCVGFGVDNTRVNLGLRNSIMMHVQKKNLSCYFMGCPCHLIHKIVSYASEDFKTKVRFDVEDVVLMCFTGSNKSTKRKGMFREFCSSSYREVIRYVSVRWVSLKRA